MGDVAQYPWTPLMNATSNGHVQIVMYLLARNPNTTDKDRRGNDARSVAKLVRGYERIIALIGLLLLLLLLLVPYIIRSSH